MDPGAVGARPPAGGGDLLGRGGELEVLGARLAQVEAGRGALVVITGEPGIGKTRLIEALADAARGRGIPVARGAAWDGGGAPAYWPWIEVVRSLRATLPQPEERLRLDLGPLWDDAASAGVPDRDPELLRFRRLDALRTLLAAASGRRGLVVALEDLHAADPGTLEGLHFVGRAIGEQRTLVVATWRPEEEAGPGRAAALARIAALGAVLRPAPLAPAHVAELLGALEPVSERLAAEIHRRSGGNPLFVHELVQHVRAGGALEELPARVGAAVAERLGRLGPGEREALEAAAVLGPEAPLGPLGSLLGIGPAELVERLRGCRGGGLVRVHGASIAFAHPLYRERLLAELDPGRRARLHLAAADVALQTAGPGAEEQAARHLLAAQPQADRARTVRLLVRAAEAAERTLQLETAVELLEEALRLGGGPAEEDGACGRRAALRLQLAELLARCGRGDRARALAREVAGEARGAADAELLARAALAHGAEIRIAVVDPELVALLEEALRAVPAGAAGLRARLLARLGSALQPAPDWEVPVRLAREAVGLARASGEVDVLLGVLQAAGSAMGAYARPAERIAISSELYEAARTRGDLRIAQQAAARLAVDAAELNDLPQAAAAAAAHEQMGAALGHPRWRWRGPLLRAMCALAEGRWSEAAAALALAEERARAAEDPAADVPLYLHRLGAFRARAAGDPAEAAEMLRGGPGTLSAQPAMSALMRANTMARMGRMEAARAALDLVDVVATRPLPLGLTAEADLAVRLGDRARAGALLPALTRLDWPAMSWGAMGYVWDGPVAHWTGGLLALSGRWDEAIADLERSLATASALAARPVAADIQCTLAAALAGRGGDEDRVRAAALADGAVQQAEALGMVHLAARARAVHPGAAARGAVVADRPAPLSLSREGDIWTIRHGARSALLRHSRGLEILAVLLGAPGREFHALELAGGGGGTVDPGSGGELLDPQARAAYRGRLRALEQEIAEAEAWNDPVRRERLAAEREFLRAELAHGLSLGGRPRRAAGAAERARVNVQKRLRGAIAKVGEVLPEAGRHLEVAVRTGLLVWYRP